MPDKLINLAFILISFGAIFMLLAIFKTSRLLFLLNKIKEKTGIWKILFFLMILFFAGYITSLFLISAEIKELLVLLIGLVFFFGALFVYLVVRVSTDSIDALNKKNKTDELNKELEKNIILLKESYDELESFSYSISHDLRTPIRAVTGFASILEKKYLNQFDEEGKYLLRIITGQGKKMGQLIDDLLAFAQLGKKEIKKSKVNMAAMANEVLDEVLKLAEKKYKAKITIKNLPDAPCDHDLIRQVWINLIENALKYSFTKPEPIIEISSSQNADSITYYIKDNGIGFDMKYNNKLFGVFQRLHNSEEYSGTGIGLAIVAKIIKRHGGKVWAEGKENEGATFYFSLPNEKI